MAAPGPQGQRWEASKPEDQGIQRVLRFREKGSRQREILVRHGLDRWLGGTGGNIVERIFV